MSANLNQTVIRKHKRHKSERKDRHEGQHSSDRQPALKLILKVGGSNSTPEHSNDSPCPPPASSVSSSLYSVSGTMDDESRQSAASFFTTPDGGHFEKHKKAKKKKKKKDRNKDREKKHKHHHKDKKRRRDESSQDDISIGEDSLNETPSIKRIADATTVQRSRGTADIHGNTNLTSERLNVDVSIISTEIGQQSPGSGNREPRTCVLRQRQERTPLTKLLEHLLKALEKRDLQQFFAWPVTDLIAPGYSHIITEPMDFSTMKQKIADNKYNNLLEFFNDFKLMCDNAMEYNHIETVYYKAAKKLLHVGTKLIQPDKIRSLRHVLPYLTEIPSEQLGFELGSSSNTHSNISEDVRSTQALDENLQPKNDPATNNAVDLNKDNKKKLRAFNYPLTKFEAIPDDLTPEEILAQAEAAARNAKVKLSMRPIEPQMGFLRQKKDGSTTLNILVGGDGVIEGSKERPISLGALTGKLLQGTSHLQGFKEDRRNMIKPAKPLCYGAFGSYAPSYDSTFANLSKEESELVYQTYGDETGVKYAESILDFSKDCEYSIQIVDNLLDILTSGEHGKTKRVLEERKRLREEEETIRKLLEEKANVSKTISQTEDKIDIENLKSLAGLGIDVSFLADFERQMKMFEEQKVIQERLESTSQLLEKLQQVQNDRLSLGPPQNLSQIIQPSENEIILADKITENLTDMAKKITPAEVVTVNSVRKAMGVNPQDMKSIEIDAGQGEVSTNEVPDLESELREFLESEPTLTHTPLHDDKTIEEILME